MELAIFKTQVPIRAIPVQDLNALIFGDFLDWISNILSLKEDAATKLEYALPAIREHCWSMGFPEIKKMIELYADGKLSVKPIPNHFDRIKFGQIVAAYRKQKKPLRLLIESQKVSQKEKDSLISRGVLNTFEIYKKSRKIGVGHGWLYQHLYDLDKFPKHTPKFREKIEKRALKNTSSNTIITKCKNIILSDYFDALIEKEIDIKQEFRY